MFWDFLGVMLGLYGKMINALDQIVLGGDSGASVGLFSLLIGFVIVNILLSVFINSFVSRN